MENDEDLLATFNVFEDSSNFPIAEEDNLDLLDIDWQPEELVETDPTLKTTNCMESFSQFKDDYFNKCIENSMSVYADPQNEVSRYFEDNLKIVRGTLTGFLINLFFYEKRFFKEEELLVIVEAELPKLRKNNGSKYYVDR